MAVPIAPGLWTDEAMPRLIGGRGGNGEIIFPIPGGDAADAYEAVPLSREGKLWSWTIQGFEPKRPPYGGPEPFAPFALGYVELVGQVIVESLLVDVGPDDLRIGMDMTLTIIPFTKGRTIFAFRPTEPRP